MKPLNGDLKSDDLDESCKNPKEMQSIIENWRCNNLKILKHQSWDFTCLNTIKNYITFETNNHMLEGPLYSKGCKKGWD